MTTTFDPLTINDAWRDALNRHDPDEVAACFTEDSLFVDHGTGQRAEGRTAHRELAAGFLGAFGDLHVEHSEPMVVGDRLAAEWTMSGVHTGDLPGLAATGRSFAVEGAKFIVVRDGLIVHATLHWNMADLLAQLGVLPSAG